MEEIIFFVSSLGFQGSHFLKYLGSLEKTRLYKRFFPPWALINQVACGAIPMALGPRALAGRGEAGSRYKTFLLGFCPFFCRLAMNEAVRLGCWGLEAGGGLSSMFPGYTKTMLWAYILFQTLVGLQMSHVASFDTDLLLICPCKISLFDVKRLHCLTIRFI